jgi:hypothetical protein
MWGSSKFGKTSMAPKSPSHLPATGIGRIMYGPPRDCKGKFGRETGLRQCIRPLMESRAPGQDELRCVSVLTSRSVVEDPYQEQGSDTPL